jgi:DNA-binding transcriptional LysR family regulator
MGNTMELRHLRYFVAVAEERSFTRAAERLWVAQPGLSTQIKRLEDELGIQLFRRHTRGVDLTDAGELLLERARTALAAADAALSTGHDLESGLVGAVRLGIATEAGWDRQADLLEAFAHEHPDVEVTVVQAYGGTLLRDLRDGRLDAVLAPSLFGSAEFPRASLGSRPWLVLAGVGHQLARERGPVDAHALEGEQLVITGHRDGAAYDRAVVDMLTGLGVTPVVRRGAPGPALLASVAVGDAVALSTSAGASGREVVTRLLDPPAQVDFELFWAEAAPSPVLNRFIETAKAIADPPRKVLRVVA